MSLLLAVGGAEAKKSSQMQKMYIFGMAASFTDTIVHFTPIQEIDSAWIDKKIFLMGREEYSYQLRDYLAKQLLMTQRTCIVVFDKNRKKLEKKYARMLNLYTTTPKKGRSYDVRHIGQQDFRFHAVNMSSIVEERLKAEQEQKEAAKAPKKKKKKDKKNEVKEAKEQSQTGNSTDGERRPASGE